MPTQVLHRLGLREGHFQLLSFLHIAVCVVLWIRAGSCDQQERDNAERRALFVGLWPPMLWLIGRSLRRHERGPLRWAHR